jgi:hypothetical protein
MYLPHWGIVLTLNIFSLLHVQALSLITSTTTAAVSATTPHDTYGTHEHDKHAVFNEIPSFLNTRPANWKTKDSIMCCFVKAIDECGAMVEQWFSKGKQKISIDNPWIDMFLYVLALKEWYDITVSLNIQAVNLKIS